MKKIILNVALLMAVSLFAKADTGKKIGDNKKDDAKTEFSIEPIGQDGRFVYLKLVFQKTDEKAANFMISDGDGMELYYERFSPALYSRIIRVSPDEISAIEIDFRSVSGNLRKQYVIYMNRVQTFRIEELTNK